MRRDNKVVASVVLMGGLWISGCERPSTARDGKEIPIELAVAAHTNAHVTLAADGDRVAAAWAATGENGTDVYAALSRDGGRKFAAPVRVNDVEGEASANGEQPPRIVIKGDAIDVLWVSKRDKVAAIRASASSDGGATFSPARTITPAGVTGPRGWESATLADDGTLHAVWLDGRNATPHVHASGAAHAAGAPLTTSAPPAAGAAHAMSHGDSPRQDIYHAMWRPSTGSDSLDTPVESPVASNVCFCCKTAIVSRGRDVYVAWRHLFPGGVRDIAIARSPDGGRTFSSPVRVSEDNWKIDACPDDGPAMTLDAAGALRVVWPTLVTDPDTTRMAIFEATSRDSGATFSPRVRMDAANAAPAHPRIVSSGTGGAAVVWDELAQGRRRVMFRRDGANQATIVGTDRVASYPSVAAVSDGFVVAWTDQSDNHSLVHLLRVQ